MNSSEQEGERDDASRNNNQEASSSATKTTNLNAIGGNKEDEMKRTAAKKLIERYFYQLTDGCGNPTCDNTHCASSGKIKDLTPDEAAAQAIKLFSQDARLCERHPNKLARTNVEQEEAAEGLVDEKKLLSEEKEVKDNEESIRTGKVVMSANRGAKKDSIALSLALDGSKTKSKSTKKSNYKINETVPFLTEELLYEIIDDCEEHNNYSRLIRTLGEVYSEMDSLSRSFLVNENESPLNDILDKAGGSLTGLKKEDVRSLEGEKDKDEDSTGGGLGSGGYTTPSDPTGTTTTTTPRTRPVDLSSLRRAYTALFKLPTSIFENALINALVTLAGSLHFSLKLRRDKTFNDDLVNILVIVFEIPALGSGDFLETALPAICRACENLPVELQARLAQIWSGPGRASLRTILENLQQLVTLRVIVTQFHPNFYVQDEDVVTSATGLMKVVYYANILAGVLESPELRHDESLSSMEDSFLGVKLTRNPPPPDPLALELGVNVLDCRTPYLPFTEFYNELLSDAIEMDRDFANYKSDGARFSFMNYSFILTPATKTLGLYFDNRIRMYSERRISFIQSVAGQPSNPYLRLKVRREHIIDDALVELEMIAMQNPVDLKKQLVVEFEGEQGIDEGGVSKEFFQLVVEEIFNPDYAMFTFQTESSTVWFNPTSFESDGQFTLIGIVLGLAIYNNVILAVNFPMVLYRKLMGKKGSFEDLSDWNPTLYNSLKQLLDYKEADIEEVFMQTFRISYQDVFGSIMHYDLKDNGDQINVTQENKYEFVDLYADFLLNKAVEKQFHAFYKGFLMVTDESPLELLFRPEEIEQLICGSKNFDFDELEGSTEYDGGYTEETPIIKDFWSVVHALSIEDKRKLLQFATGSDRVPVGGLSKLKLVIARSGPDSDRLPTAHTCFNALLLPEYSSKEKLKDRLIKAINYSKGFGML